jgi:MoaA/NifB/PqqE/SkfB family radical SAM enzyme
LTISTRYAIITIEREKERNTKMMKLTKKELEAMLKKMEEIGATDVDIYAEISYDYAGYNVDGYYIDYNNKEKFLEDEYREEKN